MNGSGDLFHSGFGVVRRQARDYRDLDAIPPLVQDEWISRTSAPMFLPSPAVDTFPVDAQNLPHFDQADGSTYSRIEPSTATAPAAVEACHGSSGIHDQDHIPHQASLPPGILQRSSLSDTSDLPVVSDTDSANRGRDAAIPPDAALQISQYDPSRLSQKSRRDRISNPGQKRRSKATACRKDAIEKDVKPKVSIQTDSSGKVAGTLSVFGLNQRVRATISEESRLATAITRRIGACERCFRNKIRCDMPGNIYEPCGGCMKLLVNFYSKYSPKFKFQPCVRPEILELRLHRQGPLIVEGLHVWMRSKQELLKMETTSNTQIIFLTQGFGEGHQNGLALPVSRFRPVDGDRTAFHWTDPQGNLRSMDLPPYFISDMDAARQNLDIFLYGARSVYVENLLGDAEPIICQTFQAALLRAQFDKKGLLSVALDTWVSSRFIESQWRIYCGGTAIGIEPASEPGHPYDGYTPITPMIDTQLDDLVIRHLIAPLSARFLQKLKSKINERKPENWLDIYLGIFIMLSNIGWITKDIQVQATWKGLKPGNRRGTLTQGFMHACKVMLSYFHFACAGSIPFSLGFSEMDSVGRTLSTLTPDQKEYVDFVQKEMAQHTKLSQWEGLSMYEDDGYWCYQLLSGTWKGNIPHAGEIDDFAEEDFLSSSTT